MVDHLTLCNFLLFSNLSSAQARSAQMAGNMHCDGALTKFWYSQQLLTDGRAALVIDPSDASPYGSKPGPTALSQLTPAEIAALVPWSTVQPFWPVMTTP
jgi:hypothetical protein